ncbi:MAG: hypothetical protein PVG84_08710 [Desulfobacterales bacterium]
MVRFRRACVLNVLVNRRHPDRRHAKLNEIIELFENTVERTSVDGRVRCLDSPLVPAEEAICHDEVNDIILGNPLVHIFSMLELIS